MDEQQVQTIVNAQIVKLLPVYLKTQAFTDRKVTDTPTDALSPVNRKYVTMNGSVAGRPSSSVAAVGQFYLDTQTNKPMWYTQVGWVNGVGSVIAST